MTWIKKRTAFDLIQAELSGFSIDDKVLENWLEKSGEVKLIRLNGRKGFDNQDVDKFIVKIKKSTVYLDINDYLECFEFAVRAYYNGMTRSDFNRGKQRDLGEYLTNQIIGKLGEIGLKKLLQNIGLAIKLDFDITGTIPCQDITQISTRPRVWNNPKLKVSIKSTKYKNYLLAIPESEAHLRDRKSDIYVLSLVGLSQDHILRLIKITKAKFIGTYLDSIPDFAEIPCRIAGWITHRDLTKTRALTGDEINTVYKIRMDSDNYIKTNSDLSSDWQKFVKLIE